MAEAGTSSVGSVENIPSPNENFTDEYDTPSIDKNELVRQSKILKERRFHVKILVLGLMGAGKSTLVNAMMGNIVAKSRAGAKAGQKEIEWHRGEHDDIRIKIYDTPGFGESDISEKKILKNIAENTPRKGYDLILIAIRMDCRLDADNAKKMLSSLGRLMDPEMWKRSIVVLTFANFLIFQLRNGYHGYTTDGIKLEVGRKTEEFKEVFQQHTGKDREFVSQIPFVLAGSINERKLPTDDDWLVSLWDHSILRCRTDVKPFLKCIRFQRLFVDLRLMIRNIFPITSYSQEEQHGECPIQNGVESSVGTNNEEFNGQGVPVQEGQVPLTDDSNGFEQSNGQSMGEEEMPVTQQQNEVEEPGNDDPDLQEDGLERMEYDLLSEIDSVMPID